MRVGKGKGIGSIGEHIRRGEGDKKTRQKKPEGLLGGQQFVGSCSGTRKSKNCFPRGNPALN